MKEALSVGSVAVLRGVTESAVKKGGRDWKGGLRINDWSINARLTMDQQWVRQGPRHRRQSTWHWFLGNGAKAPRLGRERRWLMQWQIGTFEGIMIKK